MLSVFANNRHHVIPDWPSPSQFNHCIVALRVPAGTRLPAAFHHPTLGALLAFDPTDPLTVLGDLPGGEQGSLALLSDCADGPLVRLPVAPAETARLDRVIDATLSAEGALTAHLGESSVGQAATAERSLHQLTTLDYRRALERWLAGDGASVELRSYEAREDSLSGSFRLELDFAAPLFARVAGGRLMTFRPAFVSPRAILQLADSARTRPLSLDAECFRESVTVHLPEGWAVDDLPPPIDRAADFGHVHAEWVASPGELRFVRSQQVETVTLPPERYEEVRRFFAAELEIRNKPVVLIAR